MAIWRAYRNGSYRRIERSEVPVLFTGRSVRFGSYGDPAFMPEWVVREIAAVAKRWTGYTHQWRNPANAWLRGFVMASCDSLQDAQDAITAGWRHFRVSPYGDTAKLQNEISCPASQEAGKRTTCDQCGLCNGSKPMDPRKSIVIIDHSVIAKSNPLVQIGGVA